VRHHRGREQPEARQHLVLRQRVDRVALQGPWVNGLERVEYTVGVAGCNERTTYIVICQMGTDTCFAANPDARFRSQ
jgi:hypothetical protein